MKLNEALDGAAKDEHAEEVVGLELKLAQARGETRTANRLLATQTKEIQKLESELGKLIEFDQAMAGTSVPKWLAPNRSKAKAAHMATPVLMLSDLHLDEVVDLRDMEGMNSFDREIAEARFERVISKTVDVLQTYVAGVSYEAMVVGLLGDIVTGEIHDELLETNEAPVTDTLVHWWPILASGLRYLADELDVRMFVPCVDGNHDRLGKNKKYKGRARSSMAWIMYHAIAREFADDDRFEFAISDSGRVRFPIYDTWFLAEHGDMGVGGGSGSGIGGIWPSVMRKVARDHKNLAAQGKPVHVSLIGHWHQMTYADTHGFIINGSLKGYDEFAMKHGFSSERPRQALFTVTPERGIGIRTEVSGV